MNKYQRAKSRRIKNYIRMMRACGYGDMTYKEAKRDFHFHKLILNAQVFPAYSGYRSEICFIDETPIEAALAERPKDGPFATKYLGKFHYKKEGTV